MNAEPGKGENPGGVIGRVLAWAGLVEDGLLVALLSGMVVLAAAQIALRNLADAGLLWIDPLLRVSVLWVGLLGAVAATRDDRQITVDVLSRFLPPRFRAAARVVTDLFAAAVCGVLAWHSVRLVVDERAAGTVAFSGVPVWTCELILPAAFAIITFRYLLFAVLHLRQTLGEGRPGDRHHQPPAPRPGGPRRPTVRGHRRVRPARLPPRRGGPDGGGAGDVPDRRDPGPARHPAVHVRRLPARGERRAAPPGAGHRRPLRLAARGTGGRWRWSCAPCSPPSPVPPA